MKKYFLFSAMVLITLCFGFSSCSDDDDDSGSGGSGNDFYEFTIDGKTYKNDKYMIFNDYLDSGAESGKKFNTLGFIEHETVNYYLEIGVNYFKYEKDLKEAKTGTYKVVRSSPYLGQSTGAKNLDLETVFRTEFTELFDKTYTLTSGTHTVTEIKDLGKDEGGDNCYAISGNFSFNYKNTKTNEVKEITGKYRVTSNPL